jgi:hypothetical protein
MGPIDFDFTRVQHEPCPFCDHDVSGYPAADLASALVEAARRWSEFLTTVVDHPGGGDGLRRRPQPDVWSAIEYGCHVRDGLSWTARQIELTTLVEGPTYLSWDHTSAVEADHYREQHPDAVADDIRAAAAEVARLTQRVGPAGLARTGTLAGVEFTIAGLCRHAVHEALHHLDDARVVVPAVAW